MNDTPQDDALIGTSTLRGILLLGGVAAVAYIAYQFWYKQKLLESKSPVVRKLIQIPIQLPGVHK